MTSFIFKKRHSVILIGMIGIYIFFLYFLAVRNDDYLRNNDSYDYANLGVNLWNGNGLVLEGSTYIVLPPGVSILIGLIDLVFRNPQTSGKFISFIAFILSLILIYRIGLDFLEDQKYAIWSVFLFATNTQLVINAVNGRCESLFICVFLSLIHMLKRLRTDNYYYLFFFSVLGAWLYYLRPEGIFITAIVLFWFFLFGNGRLRDRSVALFFSALIVLLLIIPYFYFLKESTSKWQLSGKTYINLVLGELSSPYQQKTRNNDRRYDIVQQIRSDPSGIKTFLEYLKDPHNDFSSRLMWNFVKYIESYWYAFSLIGIIMMILSYKRFRRQEGMLLVSLLSISCLYFFFFINYRILSIFYWILILLMVGGCQWLEQQRFFQRPYFQRIHILLFLIIICYQSRGILLTVVKLK